MTEERETDRPAETETQAELPRVIVQKRKRPSGVWLVPIVAALIGLWLGVRAILEQGPSITITFVRAGGLEPGKTQIKFKELVIGKVDTITFADDLSHVVVKVDMVSGTERFLNKGAQFWIVRPRIGARGVSGLDTLISGAYIGVSIGDSMGDGPPMEAFKGLEAPPPNPDNRPGLRVILQADSLGSLNNGSPVYFRDVKVGEIESHTLAADNKSVNVAAFIWTPYNELVRENTKFWNVSGISVAMGAEGFKVRTSSLETVVAGGVAFEIPDTEKPAKRVRAGARFKLYDDQEAVHKDIPRDLELTYIAYFDDPVRGLHIGAPVALKGIQIGTVTSVKMEYEPRTKSIRTPVMLELDPENIIGVGGGTRNQVREIVTTLVEQGLRAQLQTGSFLTGELFVELGFHPEAPPKLLGASELPELPTIPSRLRAITDRAERIMAKIENLPLHQLVESAIGVTEDARGLLKRVDPMTTNLERTLANADKTMASIQSMIAPNSVMRYDLGTALEEAATAMRSIRILASYLERHPDALIYGKFRTGGR
ncbi:MAG: PqiB family protein [Planctomycetota bacterium]|jgi:paraquat-inducible protein B